MGVFEPTTSSSTGSTCTVMSTGATAAQPSSTKATGQFRVPRTTLAPAVKMLCVVDASPAPSGATVP